MYDLNQRSILITGGTGSFGQAFIRTVVNNFAPRRLVVFSRDELKQSELQMEFPTSRYRFMRYFIGDVRDERRLETALRDVEIVVHAAALKQVPAAEYNPFECVRTNVHGAENVVNASIANGVKAVIALSTDKAANPINLYGATKLASDKIFIAANVMSGRIGTRFSVVRYGNVLGSRGSVVPIYSKMIEKGARSLPVTDPGMTRFWITLDEGVRFVLESLERMLGGEIFVPKLPSVRISDLVEAMMPGGKAEIIGIRPGEKMHEIMVTADDARMTLEFDDRYVIEPAFPFWSRVDYMKTNGGRPVAADFEYNSRTNGHWLSVDALRTVVRDHGYTIRDAATQGD